MSFPDHTLPPHLDVRSRPRTALRRACFAAFLGLFLADLALSLWISRSGTLAGRPLPPFGAITNPRQREWIAREREALRIGANSTNPGSFDAELGWTVAPKRRSSDGRVCTNSLGARGEREYAPEKPAGILRAVFFGDSYTWCDEVDDASTFEAQLEALDPRIEAFNFGVAAYGTDQALLRWRRDGRALGADVACLGILLENIGRNVNRYRPLWYPASASNGAKPRFLVEGGELLLVPHGFATQRELFDAIEDGSVLTRLAEHEAWRDVPDLGLLRFSSFARIAGAWRAQRAREVKGLWLDEQGEARRVTLAIVEHFRAEALASGAKRVLVLLFPRQDDLSERSTQKGVYWRSAVRELESLGIEVLDLSEALAEVAVEQGPAQLYGGGHLSRAGNATVATTLRSALLR